MAQIADPNKKKAQQGGGIFDVLEPVVGAVGGAIAGGPVGAVMGAAKGPVKNIMTSVKGAVDKINEDSDDDSGDNEPPPSSAMDRRLQNANESDPIVIQNGIDAIQNHPGIPGEMKRAFLEPLFRAKYFGYGGGLNQDGIDQNGGSLDSQVG